MKVFISVDMEGITGLVTWGQCSGPRSEVYDYQFARERMTADTNAAIRGAFAAGATEVVVKDSHNNSKNLLIDKLEPGVSLISGYGNGTAGMMSGMDRECTAALLVGYHAMAGTKAAVMEHTLNDSVHQLWINDRKTGEIGLSAGLAGCYDVPIVMISSDQAGCDELLKINPKAASAVVKTGIGRFMADCLHPAQSEELIFQAAREGVERASDMDPWAPELPVEAKLEFKFTHEADAASRIPGVRRLDGYTVEIECDSFAAAHQLLWQVIMVGGAGGSANR
ncbi:MAG: M55 family metallopeptidase [Chthonomonas sp.]|nr:M55 family metallopeptidase [Chthonomonas sp.]